MLPQTLWEQALAIVPHSSVAAPASLEVHYIPPGKPPIQIVPREQIILTAAGTKCVCVPVHCSTVP